MVDVLTVLGLTISLLCTSAMGAPTPWRCPECRFRTTVTRPSPYRDEAPRPVEVAADLPLLLKQAGIEGRLDPASLRLVQEGRLVPFAYRTEYDPRRRVERGYLAWLAHPRAGQMGSCDIYFDTIGRGLQATTVAAADLPPENLLQNPHFEQEEGGLPVGWQVSSPTLVGLGNHEQTIGERSLQVRVDQDTPADADRAVYISQSVDVTQFAGQEIVFECDLLAQRAAYGAPMTARLQQLRADGSRIPEYAIQPRWLTVELAEGQRVRFSERGKLSPQAATVEVVVGFRCYVNDEDTRRRVEGPESYFTVWLDRVLLRPCERWPWPAASNAGFVQGAIADAPINRAFEFTGQRRLAFNGASEATRTTGRYQGPRTVHWGLQQGTLELWCKPSWNADDGAQHVLFEGIAYGHRLQSRLRKAGAGDDNVLEFVLVDAGRKTRSVRGPAALKAGQWHHIAATWDLPRAGLQLFVDGRLIGAVGPDQTPWPSSLQHSMEGMGKGIGISDSDTRSLPMQAFIGGDRNWTQSGSAQAAIDEFRISDVVRYSADFTPPGTEFALDPNTRALFHFENERDGIHDSDDGFVRGYLGCELEPQQEEAVLQVRQDDRVTTRTVLVSPHASDEQFEATRAENRMTVTRPFEDLPDPRYIEYRPRSAERVVSRDDEGFVLHVEGDLAPIMRSVSFEHGPGDAHQGTLLPRWRANDNVVPFSVQSIAETLAPGVTDEAQKAFETFKYSLKATNYFDAHYCETLPTRHRPRVSYALIKPLNIYPFDQCGPLNHALRKLFLSAGISSNNASGTHHQFEQAFYHGSLRLFDLSSRIFWLNRDNETVLSVRGLEREPYLKIRQGGVANSWLPGRKGSATFGTAVRPHSMDFPLRPGERAAVCWHNEGRWFELRDERQPIPLAKIPPYFGNGAIVYEPTLQGDAAELVNLRIQGAGAEAVLEPIDRAKPSSLTYRAACPYIFSGAQVSGRYSGATAGGIKLSVSFDEGKTWQQVWANEDREGTLGVDIGKLVMARYAYWLRLELEPGAEAKLESLGVRSVLVASPLSLPGTLELGENTISFVGGPTESPIKTQCMWVERHQTDLGLSLNALSFYHNSGRAHRNVFIASPGAELPVIATLQGRPVTGEISIEEGPDHALATPATQSVTLKQAEEKASPQFALRLPNASEGDIESFDVVLREGDGERRVTAQVLVAQAALVREAEGADELSGGAEVTALGELSDARGVRLSDSGELAFNFTAPEAGEYALWLRAKWEPGATTLMRLTVDKDKPRDLRPTAMIGFSDWTALSRAHTKMFAHFGEQYGHWSWYRVPKVGLEAGEHTLTLGARKGAFFDCLALLPADPMVDRAAMNLFQNWNFAPWDNPM